MIYYAGILNSDNVLCGGCWEYDGHWYRITPEAEQAVRSIFLDVTQEAMRVLMERVIAFVQSGA